MEVREPITLLRTTQHRNKTLFILTRFIMSELTTILESIQSEVKVDKDGKGFVSLRGVSRLLGLPVNTIIQAIKNPGSKLTQTLFQYGFEPDLLSIEGVPDLALGLIASHYAYESKMVRAQAETVAKYLMAVGSRVALQQAVGWKSEVVDTNTQVLALLHEMSARLARLEPIAALIEDKPGLQEQARRTTGQKVLSNFKGDLLPLRDILATYEVTFDNRLMGKIALAVATTYKQQHNRKPTDYNVTNDKGKTQRIGYGYTPSDYPMIETALQQLALI